MKVLRYDCDFAWEYIGPCKNGKFVRYDDHVAALAERDKLIDAMLDQLIDGDDFSKWEPATVINSETPDDAISHPSHYTDRVPGIECIQVTQHFNFNRGNAIKYIWRAGLKGDEIEDLKKAKQYIEFEIKRMEEEKG